MAFCGLFSGSFSQPYIFFRLLSHSGDMQQFEEQWQWQYSIYS